MNKILCFSKSAVFKFVEDYIKESHSSSVVIFKEQMSLPEILEVKPDLVIITEPEIDSLSRRPVLAQAAMSHRFISLGFLHQDDLHYRLETYKVGAQDCLSMEMHREELKFKLNIKLDQVNLMKSIPAAIQCRNLILLPVYRRVLINNEEVRLANKEFEILYYILREKNKLVTNEELIAAIWKGTSVSVGNVYTQVYNLKKKVKKFEGEIINVYGTGFKLEV